jgi:hypothetical protein
VGEVAFTICQFFPKIGTLRKAIFHELYDLDDEIRNAPTAKEAKTIANQIKVNKTWEEL